MNTNTIAASAVAALLACTAGVAAGAQEIQAGAAAPQAPVPATAYRSALDYRAEAQPAASPDRSWRASNDTVAGYKPMTLTMKPMGGHAGDPAPQAASADPHAGHAAHQHGDQR